MSPLLHRPGRIKQMIYRHGFRPRPGSILFSPSLALVYACKDSEQRFQKR